MKILALTLLLAIGGLPAVYGCKGASTPSTTMNPTHAPGTEGLVISGGHPVSDTVEMFIPSTKHSCTLPSLPNSRKGHTMSGLTICGGGYTNTTETTCLHLSSGVWMVSHNLEHRRDDHSSWQSDKGMILMGGKNSDTSSEVLGQGASFDMRYQTRLACAIPDGESVLLTGGDFTMNRVSRYDASGFVAELPGLKIGRKGHGCGAYLRQDGTKVFLVAGGRDDLDTRISSTELMLEDSDVWSITSSLPRAMHGLRGVTLGNTLYMIGGWNKGGTVRDEILAWSDETQWWERFGTMKNGRAAHAIAIINVEVVEEICV